MTFTPIDHTADIGVDVEAPTLAALYVDAARGFTDALTDLETIRPTERRTVRVRAADRELLMVEWLEELVYLFDTEALVFGEVEVEVGEDAEDGVELVAELRGEPFDPDRHPTKVAVKGITYHGLAVRREGDAWRGRVIFDI